jgi:hypothetical protein
VPEGFAFEVLSVSFQLTTDATVAARTPFINFDYKGTRISLAKAQGTQAASLVVAYCFVALLSPPVSVSTVAACAIGRVIIPNGGQINFGLMSGQVGDQHQFISALGIAHPIA